MSVIEQAGGETTAQILWSALAFGLSHNFMGSGSRRFSRRHKNAVCHAAKVARKYLAGRCGAYPNEL
jgi:hypothetical protein